MNIPNLPHPAIPIATKSGHMSHDWYRFFSQFITESQKNLSEEGLNIPQQTSSQISVLQAGIPLPSIIYNKETNKPLISVNGVYKEIVTS